MDLINYPHIKYRDREDKDNMYELGIKDAMMMHYLVGRLLEEYWIVTDSVGHNQRNEITLHDALYKYSHKYRRRYRKWRKLLKKRDRLSNEFFKYFVSIFR